MDRLRAVTNAGSLGLELIGTAPAILDVLNRARQYAPADDLVLIVGEPGTGKSLLGRFLHLLSGRKGPFEVITATELGGPLGSDLLCGSRRGAFTGSIRDRAGLLARAAFGTLVLEDFHHLDPSLQLLLLRVFEERRWRSHGEDHERVVDCRLLVSTCEHPDDLVSAGKMSREIRSRLGLLALTMPRLDQRREDIPVLGQHFLMQCRARLPGGPTDLAVDALEVLEIAEYPEHVRTLRNTIHAAYLRAMTGTHIHAEHLPEGMPRNAPVFLAQPHDRHAGQLALPLPPDLALIHARGDLVRTIEAHGWNLKQAAKALGIARATLYRRLNAHGLERPKTRVTRLRAMSHEFDDMSRKSETLSSG